jgi:hypothetical protein
MNKPANILVPVILFILLVPDLLFSLPSKNAPTWQKALIHTAIFAGIYISLRIVFKEYY